MSGEAITSSAVAPPAAGTLYYRHTLPVRLMHWTNVLALTILFMSGMQIFNAYPVLNWGKSSYSDVPPMLTISARQRGDQLVGVTTVFGAEFDTTGYLGVVSGANGEPVVSAFPRWLMIPSDKWLAMARSWHFFFGWIFLVNGLLFVIYAIASRHLTRDLAPTGAELRGIGGSIRDHLRFKHASGDEARRYNVLQKLAYLAVIFGLLPLAILMGFALSPWLNSLLTGWVDIVGGRQSARTIHFIAAWLLVAFVAIHVFQVIITGLWNNMRSMITGRYRISTEAQHDQA